MLFFDLFGGVFDTITCFCTRKFVHANVSDSQRISASEHPSQQGDVSEPVLLPDCGYMRGPQTSRVQWHRSPCHQVHQSHPGDGQRQVGPQGDRQRAESLCRNDTGRVHASEAETSVSTLVHVELIFNISPIAC